MPTVIFGNARDFLAEQATKYPHLVLAEIYMPLPSEMENEMKFVGSWIAGAIDGMMHWRFAKAEDAELFKQKYGSL